MPPLKLRADSASTLPFPVLYISMLSLLIGSLLTSSTVVAQETTIPDPLVDRALSGVLNLGNVGRFIGTNRLGTLTVSSNELLNGAASRDITIPQNGFAWTSSGLLLRNGSSSDLVFDGSNTQSQSHNLEVYYFGTGSSASSVGTFSVEDFSPSLNEVDRVENDGNAVTSYGGFWNQSNLLRDEAGNEEILSFGRQGNPFTSTGAINLSPGAGDFSTRNRTNSPQPAPLADVSRPTFSAPLFRVDEESVPLQRSDALFQVEPTPSSEVAELDLSGIEINVAGQAVRDRGIVSEVIDLGRFIKDDTASPLQISRNDTVVLTTSGSDETRTRLQLSAFNVGGSNGQVSAVLEEDVFFNSASSSATVSLGGEFEIDRGEIGTFREVVQANNVTSLEDIEGQNTQSGVTLGYEYGVVDNNLVNSKDITVFKFGDFNTSGETIRPSNVELEFETLTHTALRVNTEFTLNNSDFQTVTLSEGNGIEGEGLTGEQVIAETSFQVFTRELATSRLATTEGDVVEGEQITIQDNRAATGFDTTAYVVSSNREGFDRWFFPTEGGGPPSIEAGGTLTLTPTFDETGLDTTVAEGSLGSNFRTQFSVEFQDGAILGQDDLVEGTDNSGSFSFQGSGSDGGRFDFLGSAETRQEFTFVVERAIEAEAAGGTLNLAAGTSLRDVGVNLTNALDNTTEGFDQTTVTILDGFVGGQESIDLDVNFASIEMATDAESAAAGFEILSSDIARIEGLDEVLHTLQLTYSFGDDELLIADASLLWFDEGDVDNLEDDGWVNAILGNSDIESYDLEDDLLTLAGAEEAISLSDFLDSRRFELSYTDYLLSLGEGESAALGAFGFDTTTGVVWAVIDHNSSFASTVSAIPEPSSAILLMVGSIAICVNRRRAL